jgi:hypothetical protein
MAKFAHMTDFEDKFTSQYYPLNCNSSSIF